MKALAYGSYCISVAKYFPVFAQMRVSEPRIFLNASVLAQKILGHLSVMAVYGEIIAALAGYKSGGQLVAKLPDRAYQILKILKFEKSCNAFCGFKDVCEDKYSLPVYVGFNVNRTISVNPKLGKALTYHVRRVLAIDGLSLDPP